MIGNRAAADLAREERRILIKTNGTSGEQISAFVADAGDDALDRTRRLVAEPDLVVPGRHVLRGDRPPILDSATVARWQPGVAEAAGLVGRRPDTIVPLGQSSRLGVAATIAFRPQLGRNLLIVGAGRENVETSGLLLRVASCAALQQHDDSQIVAIGFEDSPALEWFAELATRRRGRVDLVGERDTDRLATIVEGWRNRLAAGPRFAIVGALHRLEPPVLAVIGQVAAGGGPAQSYVVAGVDRPESLGGVSSPVRLRHFSVRVALPMPRSSLQAVFERASVPSAEGRAVLFDPELGSSDQVTFTPFAMIDPAVERTVLRPMVGVTHV